MIHSSLKIKIFQLVCILLVMISLLIYKGNQREFISSLLFLYIANFFLSGNLLLQICSFLLYFYLCQKAFYFYYLNWVLILNIFFFNIYYYYIKRVLKNDQVGNILIKLSPSIKIYTEYKENEIDSNRATKIESKINQIVENDEKRWNGINKIIKKIDIFITKNTKKMNFICEDIVKKGNENNNENIASFLKEMKKLKNTLVIKNEELIRNSALLIKYANDKKKIFDEHMILEFEKYEKFMYKNEKISKNKRKRSTIGVRIHDNDIQCRDGTKKIKNSKKIKNQKNKVHNFSKIKKILKDAQKNHKSTNLNFREMRTPSKSLFGNFNIKKTRSKTKIGSDNIFKTDIGKGENSFQRMDSFDKRNSKNYARDVRNERRMKKVIYKNGNNKYVK